MRINLQYLSLESYASAVSGQSLYAATISDVSDSIGFIDQFERHYLANRIRPDPDKLKIEIEFFEESRKSFASVRTKLLESLAEIEKLLGAFAEIVKAQGTEQD